VERYSLRQLSEVEVRKQYQIKMLNRSAALENLNDSKGISRTWENIKENIRISAKKSGYPTAWVATQLLGWLPNCS
jgi:hypothetical protein